MSKPLIPFKSKGATIDEINRLHAKIVGSMSEVINTAIEIGRLLLICKKNLTHGNWRTWIENNLSFSRRNAQRYIRIYLYRDKILKAKSVNQAEQFLKASNRGGEEAIEADYSRIDHELIAPIRAVRRKLRRITYKGDSPEIIEMIMENLIEEVQGLIEDLK